MTQACNYSDSFETREVPEELSSFRFPRLENQGPPGVYFKDHIKVELPIDIGFKRIGPDIVASGRFESLKYYNRRDYGPGDRDPHLSKFLAWLDQEVGPTVSYEYRLPYYGKNWGIFRCGSEDHNPNDWCWRISSPLPYSMQGSLGVFLVVFDENLAIEMKLNGILDALTRT